MMPSPNMKTKEKILNLIEEGHNTIESLFEQMKKVQPDIKRSTIRGRLYGLRRNGIIDELGNGYRIV